MGGRRTAKPTLRTRALYLAAAVAGIVAVTGLPLGNAAVGGTALQLNGTSQYATLGASGDLQSATFTVELWFQRTGAGTPTSTGNGGITNAIPLITKGRAEAETAAADVNYFLGIDATSGKLVADFEEGQSGSTPSANHPITGTTAIPVGTAWHHAAATYDGSTWNLYLDGTLDGTLAVNKPANAATTSLTAVGSALTTAGTAAGFFSGVIDEVRIWNSARTLAQIQASKDTEITTAQTGLLGVWNLDEGSGSSLTDHSGNGKTGAAVAAPTWVSGFAPPGVNNPPVAVADCYQTPESSTLTVAAPGVLGNDSDADGNTLTAVKVTDACTRHADTRQHRLDQLRPDLGLQRPGQLHLQGKRRDGRLEHGHGVADGDCGRREHGAAVEWVDVSTRRLVHLRTCRARRSRSRRGSSGPVPGSGRAPDRVASRVRFRLIAKGRRRARRRPPTSTTSSGSTRRAESSSAISRRARSGTTPHLNHPITGTTVITADSTWHHAAATYDGTTWNLYLDGALDGSLTVGQPANAATNVARRGWHLEEDGRNRSRLLRGCDRRGADLELGAHARADPGDQEQRDHDAADRSARRLEPRTREAAAASPTTPATARPAQQSPRHPGCPASCRRARATLRPRRRP